MDLDACSRASLGTYLHQRAVRTLLYNAIRELISVTMNVFVIGSISVYHTRNKKFCAMLHLTESGFSFNSLC